MKKKVNLFLIFAFIATTISAQENLIKDGKFDNTSFNVSDIYRNVAGKGKWYPYLTGDRLAVISVVEDEEKGNAVKFQALSHVSYAYSYVGQRVEKELEPGVYRVGVWAKSLVEDPLAVLNIYLRVNTSPQRFLFFKIADFDPEANPNRSGALYQKRINSDWEYYTVDFDLGKTIDSAANYKITTDNGNTVNIENSSSGDRKDLYLGISCTTRNSQFLFTDISLTKVE